MTAKTNESIVASHTEIFLYKKLTPELLTPVGKVSVSLIFFVWFLLSLYGWFNVEIDFEFDWYITDKELHIYKFKEHKKRYFAQDGESVYFYTNSTKIDFYSE